MAKTRYYRTASGKKVRESSLESRGEFSLNDEFSALAKRFPKRPVTVESVEKPDIQFKRAVGSGEKLEKGIPHIGTTTVGGRQNPSQRIYWYNERRLGEAKDTGDKKRSSDKSRETKFRPKPNAHR